MYRSSSRLSTEEDVPLPTESIEDLPRNAASGPFALKRENTLMAIQITI